MMSDLREIENSLNLAMQVDRFALRGMLKSVKDAQRAGKPHDQLLEKLKTRLEKSRRRFDERAAWKPRLDWDNELPVVARKQEIIDAIRDNQVIVLCGETGSGKSTQLPRILVEMGRGISGVIGHTQPRRIAARSVAARLAEEMNCRLGQEVGFRIRFTDSSTPNTRIRLMTDGILLAETQTDRFLDQYDTIIVDEAHERSLNIDFLLGYLKRLLPKRRDLKVIITSATIDAARFSEHFGTVLIPERDHRKADHPVQGPLAGNSAPHTPRSTGTVVPAPVLQISGRTYPVEIRYRPLDDEALGDESNHEPRDWLDGVSDAIDELTAIDSGHILVFLPTERDIRETAKKLGGKRLPGDTPQRPTEIVPLFGRLSMADQTKVFTPCSHRRIVLATNVAESSLTVPGIRYVIDTGTARISRYSARSRMQRLPVEPISQASANQRAGRCGRVGPGICIRLYSKDDFDSREPFTAPEIQRTNLAAVILRTIHLRLGNIEEFPFLDPPRSTTVREGYKTLEELGAITATAELTEIGKRMARLPVDPRISRMILAAVDQHALPEVLAIASFLESQDPRERPVDKQQAADEAHRKFANRDSDFLTILNLWDAWHEQQRTQSQSQIRKWCQKSFLSFMRMREWADVHTQLKDLLADSDDPAIAQAARHLMERPKEKKDERQNAGRSIPDRISNAAPDGKSRSETVPAAVRHNDFAATHKSLMTGLLANIGYQTPNGEFMGAGGQSLAIWPGSALAPRGAKWFVAGELVETSRRFARTIARIQPEWIEPLAEHLVSREYFEPHWDSQAGNVMVFEKVSLWGLPIVPRRKVTFARVDALKAREMLIQHGLVEFGLLFGDSDPETQNQPDFEDEEDAFSRGASRVRPGRGHSNPAAKKRGWGHEFPFLKHNHTVLEQLQELQARTRSHHLLPGDEALYQFYSSQIPDDCCDRDRLRRWFQRTATRNQRLLQFDINQFADESHRKEQAALFPESAQFGAMHLPLSYQLDPGCDADGVTVTVPVEGVGQLSEARLEWLVPGLLEQKVLALIRSLPKHLRRHFVPAPETAKLVASDLEFGRGDLLNGVATRLSQLSGERFDSREFDLSMIEDHLKFNILVVDDERTKIMEGRDVKQLRTDLLRRAQTASTPAEKATFQGEPAPEDAKWTRGGFKGWDFFEIPEHIEIKRAGMLLRSFPSLRDDGESVSLMLCQTPEEAGKNLRAGLRKLILLAERKRILIQIGNMPQIGQVKLLSSSMKGLELMNHLSMLMVDRAYLPEPPLPRTKDAFDRTVQKGRERLGLVAQEFVQFLPHLFQQYHETRRALEQAKGPGWDHLLNGMRTQLASLINPTFLVDTPWPCLIQFPRYFTGIRTRLQRLGSGGLKTEISLEADFAPW
ncbi:MAG: ATP-dependent RNA helicase HrpA, partial [Planctomycetota bacterium]